jgi:hypothetical protein
MRRVRPLRRPGVGGRRSLRVQGEACRSLGVIYNQQHDFINAVYRLPPLPARHRRRSLCVRGCSAARLRCAVHCGARGAFPVERCSYFFEKTFEIARSLGDRKTMVRRSSEPHGRDFAVPRAVRHAALPAM